VNRKYRLEALVGHGAFGEVYRATHLRLNAPRAVKVLRRDMPGVGSETFQTYRERFDLEAPLGAGLDHPNVIKVYYFDTTRNGCHPTVRTRSPRRQFQVANAQPIGECI